MHSKNCKIANLLTIKNCKKKEKVTLAIGAHFGKT